MAKWTRIMSVSRSVVDYVVVGSGVRVGGNVYL